MENKLYEGVQNDLKQKIEHGVYPEGYKLASENYLCEEYNVSKVTLRKALSNLIEEQYIESRPRVGYFVKTARPGIYRFSYSMSNVLNTHIMGVTMMDAKFRNDEGVNVFEMARRYFNDDEEWAAYEEISIVFKHSLQEKRKLEKDDAYFERYAASILALAERKKMTIEMIRGSEAICNALEIFDEDILLKLQEKYFDEYGKQFAQVSVYIPSDYAVIQASNKKEESVF